jgi:hypothetical protein
MAKIPKSGQSRNSSSIMYLGFLFHHCDCHHITEELLSVVRNTKETKKPQFKKVNSIGQNGKIEKNITCTSEYQTYEVTAIYTGVYNLNRLFQYDNWFG